MDCGPAALKALLGGFGVKASYGRLREACQTDLDGTSINTLEDVVNELGLEAEQILIPADHVLLPEARTLPAVVVVGSPSGLTHFIVLWRRHGRWIQIMDPATGRQWSRLESLRSRIHIHRHHVPATAWRDWSGSDQFLDPLGSRLRQLGLSDQTIQRLTNEALADRSWRGLASLDACTRMLHDLVTSGGIRKKHEAGQVLSALLAEVRTSEAPEAICPERYWSVGRTGDGQAEGEQLWFRGAVLVRVRAPARPLRKSRLIEAAARLSPDLAAALSEPDARPGRTLLGFLLRGGRWPPLVLLGLLFVTVGGLVFEAILLRGFIEVGRDLTLFHQRLVGIGVLCLFLVLVALIELPIAHGVLRLGRHLESRLRLAFMEKIPRLKDRYFASRLTSDMAERSHSIHKLRRLPNLAEWLTRSLFELFLTAAGILWIDPGSLVPLLASGAVVIALPSATLWMVQGLDLRVRSHHGALGRFYLDALRGLAPIRAHGAERAVAREHEALLLDWARAHFLRERVRLVADGVLHLAAVALTAWLIVDHLNRKGLTGSVLLMAYWSLNLLSLGQLVSVMLGRQYPSYRSIALRLLEPLGAPEERQAVGSARGANFESPAVGRSDTKAAVSIALEGVVVRAGGHTILRDINLNIAGGSHVAIVGPSGAGKSTLVGILLGWHQPANGRLLVDGNPLDAEALRDLREATAWVDPAVQLWNRSLLANLRYGLRPDSVPDPGAVIDQADLLSVLAVLPDGLQGVIGESGGLVSGGEGQRVRLARAMLRKNARLVILDEPFRGLDRRQRAELLGRARALWIDATLLCITHDLAETRGFHRVVVMEGGSIVEDASPAELAKLPDSRYRAMLAAEKAVRERIWEDSSWRRFTIDSGRLYEDGEAGR